MSKLYIHEASGPRLATDTELMAATRAMLARRVRRGCCMDRPYVARDFLRAQIGDADHEVFVVIYLDTRHRLIHWQPLFRGTIDGASVHPREVVKEALKSNAAAVIFAHNHPSGIAEPSHADELITRRLREALSLVEIRVLDHFVVAGDAVLSFAERGLL